MIQITRPLEIANNVEIALPASKSISNRLLVLQALDPRITINNLSEANDTRVLARAFKMLSVPTNNIHAIDVEDAGTAFRFLLAYCAGAEGIFRLDGTARLRERPISELVEALRALGAKIVYEDQEGFAPLLITGTELQGGTILVDASVSSQFISALLLVGWRMPQGLRIQLKGEVVSEDYIQMTVKLLQDVGVIINRTNDLFEVAYCAALIPRTFEVERDWSGAGYFYAMMLGMKKGSILLSGLTRSEIQADAVIVEYGEKMGVKTDFSSAGAHIYYQSTDSAKGGLFHCLSCPDLAQTLMVMCCIEGISGVFEGLETLRLKETNRIAAMGIELQKMGWDLRQRGNQFMLHPTNNKGYGPILFSTYKDHRMAMALSAFSAVTDIIIEEEGVVHKSFPLFWQQLTTLGFKITQV